jgi:hypothetical protein
MNKVLMKFCPICKRYFPADEFEKHLKKHNLNLLQQEGLAHQEEDMYG